MPVTKPLYDLVLMLDTASDDDRRAAVLNGVEQAVAKGGEVVNQQDWGARALAFEIRHKKDAEYHLLQFHGSPELLAQLDRTLRITDEVVRFRIIKLAPGTPAPPDQRSEPNAGGADGDAPTYGEAAGTEESVAPSEETASAAEAATGEAAAPADDEIAAADDAAAPADETASAEEPAPAEEVAEAPADDAAEPAADDAEPAVPAGTTDPA